MSQYTQENCQEACRAKPATPYGTLKHSCGTCLNSIRRCLWDTHHGLWVPLSVPLSCWCSRFQSHLRKAQERSQVTSALGSGCSLGSRYSSKWLDVYKGGRQWAWGLRCCFHWKGGDVWRDALLLGCTTNLLYPRETPVLDDSLNEYYMPWFPFKN